MLNATPAALAPTVNSRTNSKGRRLLPLPRRNLGRDVLHFPLQPLDRVRPLAILVSSTVECCSWTHHREELRSVLGKVVWRRSAWHAHLTRLQTVAAFPEQVPGHAEDVRSVGCSDWCWNASHRFSRASPLVGLTLMSLNSSPQGDLESTWRKRGEQRIWGDHSSVEKDERSIEVMGTSSNMAARPVYLVVPASRAKCGSVDC